MIEVAGRSPVLARGGGRVPEDELPAKTAELIAGGASGIVYGRNVIQHADPSAIVAKLMQIVHG